MSISIVLNLSLGLYLVFARGSQREPAKAPVPYTDRPSAAGLSAIPVPDFDPWANSTSRVTTFSWRAVESSDYRIYVQNLRNIGCPEQTIRDIIVADVGNLYKSRTHELEQKLSKLNGDPSSRLEVEAKLQSLPAEENKVIATLLGSQAPVVVDETREENSAQDDESAESQQHPVLPLAFSDVDFSVLQLDETQALVIASLRQKFWNLLGGEGQNPNDPQYLERWQKAQPELDSWLKGMIGLRAYQELELAARARHAR